MRRTPPAALVALVTVSLVVGHAAHRPHARRVPAASSLPPGSGAPSPPARPPAPPEPDPTAEPKGPDDRTDLMLLPGDGLGLPILTRIWMADEPRGSVPSIALRFLQSVQRGDDLAADRQLYHFDRYLFIGSDLGLLHRTMNDVRRHAGLAGAGLPGAGPCVRATRLAREMAVVLCGRIRVVVHVAGEADDERGVQINERHVRHDVYRGAHTHAFTQIFLRAPR